MTSQPLTRDFHRAPTRPSLTFLGDLALPLARAHEICGNARRFLALLIAGRMQGPVFWIAPAWQPDQLNAEAVTGLLDPGRLIFLDASRAEDLLWCTEEVLRCDAAPLVIADLPAPPGLTAIRRLHLAAEACAAENGNAPLGLVLTPGTGGAPGVETRWHITAQHQPGGKRIWRLDRSRARMAPQKTWEVRPKDNHFQITPYMPKPDGPDGSD